LQVLGLRGLVLRPFFFLKISRSRKCWESLSKSHDWLRGAVFRTVPGGARPVVTCGVLLEEAANCYPLFDLPQI
jgi:hypothetical protein